MYPGNPDALNSFFIGLFLISFCAGLLLRFRKNPIVQSASIGALLTSTLALFMGLSYSFDLKTAEFLLYFLATLLASLISIAVFGANMRLLIAKNPLKINSISRFRMFTFIGFGIGILLIALPVLATAYLWIGVIFLMLVTLFLLRSASYTNSHH
ncbi:hypothetical protein [Ekhidna sp.]|uniref:hypothetical protein n=1 Tax=Ekhidna sp. TaxID=2608089 RepID=UPI003CCBB589